MNTRIKQFIRHSWRRWIGLFHYSLFNTEETHISVENKEYRTLFEKLQKIKLSGPSLRSTNVTDYGATNFVADPFLLLRDNIHLFFEIQNPYCEPTAVIGHAVSRDNGNTWAYNKVVLESDRHASFPYVFEAAGETYLIPGFAKQNGETPPARLYRAADFPSNWEPVVEIVDADHACLDTIVFPYDDRWWAIMGSGNNDELRVYFNDTLESPNWNPHPKNPVVSNRIQAGRPAGRPLVQDKITLFLQDSKEEYGSGVRAYEVTELTPAAYSDSPLFTEPILEGTEGIGWNSGRMHHIDIRESDDEIYCAVDGDVGCGRNRISGSMWSIGFGKSNNSGTN